MPLMVFIGEKNQTRRTPKARGERLQKAEKRGWGRERQLANKMSGGGGGAQSSSRQQVNATRGGGGWSSSDWSWGDTSQAGKPNTNGWGSCSSSSNKWN